MNRATLIDHLAQVEHHVAEGESHLARLRALIAHLEKAGHNTTEAEIHLLRLVKSQALHLAACARICAKLDELN
jgi:hypothetical protein